MIARPHARACVDAKRLVKVTHGSEGVGHSDIRQHRLLMLTQAREQHRCLTIMQCGLRISIAVQVQATEVLAHSRSGPHVAYRKQLFLCGFSACSGLIMLTQHGQSNYLGYLGLGCGVRQSRVTKSSLGQVEKTHRFGHLAAQNLGYTPGPISNGLDLTRLLSRYTGHKKIAHGHRRPHPERRIAAPGLVTDVLQGPGKRKRALASRRRGRY